MNEFMYELPMETKESSFYAEVDGELSKFTVIFQRLNTLNLYQVIVADWDNCEDDCIRSDFTSDMNSDKHLNVSMRSAHINVHIEIREASYLVTVSKLK